MRMVKFRDPRRRASIGLLEHDSIVPLSVTNRQYRTLSDLFDSDDPAAVVELLAERSVEKIELAEVTLLPPIDQHEVWGAGVTYARSKSARMEESQDAASFYDKVYEASRPELFFKANPHRVAGPGAPLRIRQDSQWSVPEPEVALVLNSRLQIVGYTIGNDMSARDIEGENPLYLPQAKVYDDCCALGPCVTLAGSMPTVSEIGIQMVIRREGATAFEGRTSVAEMARSFEYLVRWLARDNTFPHGVILLTGTGIVPDDDFSLEPGDVVEISIDGIGTLSNPVVRA